MCLLGISSKKNADPLILETVAKKNLEIVLTLSILKKDEFCGTTNVKRNPRKIDVF